ncbi:putative PLD phosphodiesterase domain-containing protein [Seiridium cardinale]
MIEGGDDAFFLDGRGSPDSSVAGAIIEVLNDEKLVNRQTVRPVIRFLMGNTDRDPYKDPKYWDTSRLKSENIFWDKEGHHLIQHPLAVEVGIKAAKKAIVDIAGLVAPYVLGVSKEKITQMLNMMFENVSMSVSWNYGKILADPRKVIDMQSVVTGDAVILAHLYADYFWKGLIPVLSVARMGDWHGSTFTLDYPVQIFDAMRDVLVNAQFPIVPAHIDDSVNRKPLKYFVEAANKLADDGPYFRVSSLAC